MGSGGYDQVDTAVAPSVDGTRALSSAMPPTLYEAHAAWKPAADCHALPASFSQGQVTAVRQLIESGERRLQRPEIGSNFETGYPEGERTLNDLAQYPHLFVIGCLMERAVQTRRAWRIPLAIGRMLGGFEFDRFGACTHEELRKLFLEQRLHRYSATTADATYKAIRLIAEKYNGDASQIWSGGVSSAAIIHRFLEFAGAGLKIANMATNILARDFRVPMREYASIDIAPDRRVRDYFEQLGLLHTKKPEEIVYLARDLYPWYPGMLDIGAWEWERRPAGN